MLLLHFFPDWLIQFIVHTILIAGVAGCLITFQFANKILLKWPPLAAYYVMAKVASVVLLVSGIYFEGGYSAEMQWRDRVREVEARLVEAEKESKDANVALDKKSAEKVKVIKGREVVVKQYIDREVAKYNDQCNVPKAFVDAHNMAAEQPK
jgi:hypothetical protein